MAGNTTNNDSNKGGTAPGDKPGDKPPAPPPFDVMAACSTVCNALKGATQDEQRRVLTSAATLLGIQRPPAPRGSNGGGSQPQQQRSGSGNR